MNKLTKKDGINKDIINIFLFVVFLSLGTYFIIVETWLWPVKVLIFIILVSVLKSAIFAKKQTEKYMKLSKKDIILFRKINIRPLAK